MDHIKLDGTHNMFKMYIFTVMMQLLAYSTTMGENMTYHHDHNVQHHTPDMEYAHALEGILLRSKIQEVIHLKNDGKHPGRITPAGTMWFSRNMVNFSKVLTTDNQINFNPSMDRY